MNLQGKTIRKLTLSLLLLFWAGVSFAASISSTSTGGNWNNTGTWVGGILPTAADDVTIVDGAAVNASNLSIAFNSLTIEANGGSGGGTLTVGNTTITSGAAITNNGTLTWGSSGLTGAPTTITNTNGATVNLSGNNSSDASIDWVNQSGGSIIRNGANSCTLAGTFTNESGATLTVNASSSLFLDAALTNTGSVVVEGLFTCRNIGIENNTGYSYSGGGIFDLGGTITLSGTADFMPGVATVRTFAISTIERITSSNNRGLIVPASTSMELTNTTIDNLSGITNNGTLEMTNTSLDVPLTNNATLNLIGTLLTNLGTNPVITNSSTGTINLTANNQTIGTVDFLNQTGGNIIRSGANGLSMQGVITNESGATLTVNASSALALDGGLVNTGDVVVEGLFTCRNIEIENNTGYTYSGAGTFDLGGTTTLSGTADFVPGVATVRTFAISTIERITSSNNRGLIVPASTSMELTNTTIDNLSGITNNGTLEMTNTSLDVPLTNNATLNLIGTLLTNLGTNPVITNSSTGTINLTANNQTIGTVDFLNQAGGNIIRSGANGLTMQGVITNESGATLTVNAGVSLALESSLVNTGDVVVEGLLICRDLEIENNTGYTYSGTGFFDLGGITTLSGTADFMPGVANVRTFPISTVERITSSNNRGLIVPAGTTMELTNTTIDNLSGITNNGTIETANTSLDVPMTNNATLNIVTFMNSNLGTNPVITNVSGATINLLGNNQTITNVDFLNQAGADIIRNGANNVALAGNLTNEPGATVTVDASRALSLNGTATNNGLIANNGTLFNNGLFQGTGNVQGNILVTGNGIMAPGLSPGILNFANDYQQNVATTTFSAEIAGTTPGTQHDQIIVGGTATIGGTLETSFDPVYGFTTNDVITLIDANAVSGTFANVTPALPADWTVRYDFPNTGEVSLEYTGPGTVGTGGSNNALSFFPGDYVSVANPNDFEVGAATDFSIEAEIKTTFNNSGARYAIFSKMVDNNDPNQAITGYQFWIWDGKLTIEWFENGNGPFFIQSSTIVSDAQCHHVAVTVDRANTTAKLYVDGVLETTVNDARYGIDINNIAPVYIGRDRTGGGQYYFYGIMDEVAFFNEVRTDAQIATSAANDLNPVTEANLIGYWKFNEGVDGADNTGVTTAPDAAGGDNNGTLMNFDLTGTQIVTNAPNGVPGSSSLVAGNWVADPCGSIAAPVTDLQFIVGNDVGGPNQTVTVPITVRNFNNIFSYQGSIIFDPAVLTFVSATSTLSGTSFGDPNTGTIPANTITFGYFDGTFAGQTLADGTVVAELTFTVNASASTGTTPITIDGSSTPLGYTDDIAATTLSDPSVINGGVEIDADPIVINTVSIISDNANNTSLAKAGDVITLTFNLSEVPFVTPVVTIAEGGPGAVTVTGSGTDYTATKTVATGSDGLVTFSITVEDEAGNQTVSTATTDASEVTVDTELPTIVCPADLTPGNDAGVCNAVVSWTAPAGADNRPNFSVAQTAGPTSGSTFPVSATATTITYTVTDEAGNEASCSFTVQVSDTELPVVNTTDITVQLDGTGNATITTAQIEAGSTDNCAVDPSGFSLDKTAFTCADIGTVTVTLTVTDVNSNTNTGTATVTVEEAFVAEVSGQAVTEPGTPAPTTPVTIPNVDFDVNTTNPSTQSSAAGTYAIDLSFCVTEGAAADIGATKVDPSNNGIDVADAIATVFHVLNAAPFNGPYKRIAADVNTSGDINIIDAFQIARKVGLQFSSFSTIGTPGDWSFIPSDFVFADPLNPWTFDTRRNFATLPGGDLSGQDFIGVKYGDVNNTYNLAPARPATDREVRFAMGQVNAQPGELVTIPVSVKEFNNVAGYQYTLQWDPSVLQFEGVEDQVLESVFSTHDVQNGNLTAVWFDVSGQSVSLNDGDVAFELSFRVVGGLGSQTPFHITSALTPSKAYEADLTLLNVTSEPSVLTVGSTTSVDPELAGYSLVQNFPNPFTSSTSFEFSLGQSEDVRFEIYSLTGQVVRSFEARYTAGDHSLEWDGKTQSGVSVSEGVYLVRMTAGEFSSSIRVQKL